jgi:hypothetical protein
MPKYLFAIMERQGEYAEAGEAGFDAIMRAHGDFAAAVAAAGAKVLGGEALQPTSTATYLRGTRTDAVHAVDNPMPEVKEVLGGYYLIEAADEGQAVELAKKCPAPYGYIEVRPIWEFGEQS